jgi:hypothetical protein
MSNWCLTHGSFTEFDLTDGIDGEGCLIVSCPPVEFEIGILDLEDDFLLISPDELAQMNASAEELRLQFEGE